MMRARLHPSPLRRPQRGFSFALVLIAVTLVAALGVVMTLSDKAGNLTAETNKYKLLASAILRQATVWHDAVWGMSQSLGIYPDEPDPTGAVDGHNLLAPDTGFMEQQLPPPDAFASVSSATWVWQRYTISLMNVGTSSQEVLVDVVNLTPGVCQQLNELLYGSTSIPVETTGTSTGWSTTAGMNLSSEAAVNGKLTQCIKTSDGQYVFYYVLVPV